MQNSVLTQLEQLEIQWQSIKNIPDDLTAWGYPLTKADLDGAFSELKGMAQLLTDNQEFEPHKISLAAADAALINLGQFVTSHIPSNPSGNIRGLIIVLDTLRTLLGGWIEESDPRHKKAITAAIQKLAEATARMNDAAAIYETLKSSSESVNQASLKAEGIVETLDKMMEESQDGLTQLLDKVKSDISAGMSVLDNSMVTIKEKERQVGTLMEIATQDTDKIISLAGDLRELKQTVETALTRQANLFEDFETYRNQAKEVLGDTNRASMAGAFIQRCKTYTTPLWIWGVVFVASLVSLGAIAFWVVHPLIGFDFSVDAQASSAKVTTQTNWIVSFLRLPLSIPAIWLAWFSVRQYGYNTRLMEDYAYKAASAQAFEGYKREAKEAGDEMQNKLLETAISHLSDNPIRVYESGNNHGSPAHELFEKVFKDDKLFHQLLEIIDRMKPRS